MSDVTPPLFVSPDEGKDSSQVQPSQNQGDSPRATQPTDGDDYAAYLAWKNENHQPEPADSAATVSTGRRAAPTEATKSEAKADIVEEEETPQSYVWLQNGEVVLANDEDLPESAGQAAQFGHWVKDGKAFTIVAVYPKEITLKGSK